MAHGNFRVEVQDDKTIVLILPKRMDSCRLSLEPALLLAYALSEKVQEAKNASLNQTVDHACVMQEQAQLKMSASPGKANLFFGWADRLVFCWQTAFLLVSALQAVIQEAQALQNRVQERSLIVPGGLDSGDSCEE